MSSRIYGANRMLSGLRRRWGWREWSVSADEWVKAYTWRLQKSRLISRMCVCISAFSLVAALSIEYWLITISRMRIGRSSHTVRDQESCATHYQWMSCTRCHRHSLLIAQKEIYYFLNAYATRHVGYCGVCGLNIWSAYPSHRSFDNCQKWQSDGVWPLAGFWYCELRFCDEVAATGDGEWREGARRLRTRMKCRFLTKIATIS